MSAGVRACLGALAALLGGCGSAPVHVPGSEVLGLFALRAEPRAPGPTDAGGLPPCVFSEAADGGFDFAATFSRDPGTSDAWVTLPATSHAGTFDGQTFLAVYSAQRLFGDCACPANAVEMRETLEVALFSRSQSDAVGGSCPPDALDGGVPPPDADAGVTGPASTQRGFDALLACGRLRDEVLPDPSRCACGACEWNHVVTGVRR